MKKSNCRESINAQANALLVSNLLKVVDTNRLAELVTRDFGGEDMVRVCLYLNGSLTVPSFPHQKMWRPNSDCPYLVATFKAYDVFSDSVSFEYDEDVTRFFDSQEKADKWATEESPYEWSGDNKEHGNYVFPATRSFHKVNSTSSYNWEKLNDLVGSGLHVGERP